MVVPEVSEFYRPTYSSLNLGISAFTRSNSRRLMPISFAACSRVTRSTRGPSSWPRNSLITVLCKGPCGPLRINPTNTRTILKISCTKERSSRCHLSQVPINKINRLHRNKSIHPIFQFEYLKSVCQNLKLKIE